MKSRVNVKSQYLYGIKFKQLHLTGAANNAISPVQTHNPEGSFIAHLQQEFIFPLGTALSQALMGARFLHTNTSTVLQCLYTNWGCCKFRDK